MGFWLLVPGVGMGGGTGPEIIVGPRVLYRPGAAVPPTAYRPLSPALPSTYRPNNPTTPGG